ncbi:hypothetical protein GCM10028817_26590 [Spirosoma pomorum]
MVPQAKTLTSPATNLRLTQMVVTGDNGGLGPFWVTTRFTYKKDRLLQRAIYSPNSPNPSQLTLDYNYDQQDRVSSYLVQYEKPYDDGNTGERHSFTYKENGFEYKSVRIKADGQPLASQSNNLLDIYLTNQAGQVTEWIQEGIIRYGRPTRARYVYTYENGNIVKASYLNGDDKEEFSISYQYDDKVNPFYGWMYAIDPVLRYSRNNIVQSQVSQAPVRKNEYTYNEQGFPLTKKEDSKGALMTYTYESF